MAENFDAEAELQKVLEKKAEMKAHKEIANVTKATDFTNAVDEAKLNLVRKASAEDDKFVQELTNDLKDAVKKSAQLEKEKQALEIENIALEQNYIQTKNELESQKQKVNKWENKQKAREYHYNGLKDIMEFIHINNPMCIPLMYLFAFIISPIYILWTILLCPLGTLIAGTKDNNRPQFVKGAIYTILLLALILAVVLGGYSVMHYWLNWF